MTRRNPPRPPQGKGQGRAAARPYHDAVGPRCCASVTLPEPSKHPRPASSMAGVPACELRGVRAPAVGTGGETPPELAGEDACGTGSPRSADFPVCCIAGFQTRRRSAHPQPLGSPHAPETPWPLPIWKSATQQVGKPALPGRCADASATVGWRSFARSFRERGSGCPNKTRASWTSIAAGNARAVLEHELEL